GQPACDSAGIQCGACGYVRAGRGPQRLRRSAQHGTLLASAGTVEPDARCGGGKRIDRNSDERAEFEYYDLGGWRQAPFAEAQRRKRAIPGTAPDSIGGGTWTGSTRYERGTCRSGEREHGAPIFRRWSGDWPEFPMAA